jgi:hypothetical protein
LGREKGIETCLTKYHRPGSPNNTLSHIWLDLPLPSYRPHAEFLSRNRLCSHLSAFSSIFTDESLHFGQSSQAQEWVAYTATVKAFLPRPSRTPVLLLPGLRRRPSRLLIRSASSQRREQLLLRSVSFSEILTVLLK